MKNSIKAFIQSSAETKLFILTWTVYAIALIATTLYCYGRLDYVRSYHTDKPILRE